MISTAIFFFSAGAILTAFTFAGWLVVHGGTRKPTPLPEPKPDTLSVYLLEREMARIEVEFDILSREEGWRK